MKATRDQVSELRKQTIENHQQNVETQRDRYRPLVYPTGKIPVLPNDQKRFCWDREPWGVDLKNAGAGVALAICGVVFGPKPTKPGQAKTERYTLWRDQPLLAGAERCAAPMEFGVTQISGDTMIGSHTLFAPGEPTYDEMRRGDPWVVARLTLTYRDIFGLKHASISDYHELHGWQSVAFLANIPADLVDLDHRGRPL